MARTCVHYNRFAKANGWKRATPGTKIEAELSCLRNQKKLVYLGGGKHGKGGCKYGWRYKYEDKDGKFRTGCYKVKGGPRIVVDAVKKIVPTVIIPNYTTHKRKKKGDPMSLSCIMN